MASKKKLQEAQGLTSLFTEADPEDKNKGVVRRVHKAPAAVSTKKENPVAAESTEAAIPETKVIQANVEETGEIKGIDHLGRKCTLVDKASKKPILVGTVIREATVTGGLPPYDYGSSGRIYVSSYGQNNRKYYPDSFDAEWISEGT